MKISGLLFWVQENNISVKFYKRLGFDIIRSDDERSIVSLDGLQITLINMRDEEKFAKDSMSSDKGRGLYIYIRVTDADTTYKELVNLGFNPATSPKDWQWGNREFILKDPDGYKLCFWQPIKGASV